MSTRYAPFRREKAGRFGTHPVAMQGSIATFTANDTTDVVVGCYPAKACIAPKFSVAVTVAPADADGAITGILYKYDASANAAVALSAATDLETLTAFEGRRVDVLATLTDAQRTLDEGDFLYFRVTNDSAAINTQPGVFVVNVEVFVLE